MPRVIDIQRRHMELGRIRLGEKGAKGQPTRLDTWRLTSASRSLMDSAAAVYGGTVEEWTDAPDKGYWQLTTDTATLDVIVPPGDPYSQFYELWSGGGCKRRCTGEIELLTDTACKCDPEERECKITTRINVMLPRVAGLGVWRLESHGYYAAAELPDALDLLQQISGGRMVSGLLRIEQRSSKRDGRTNRYPVPVLDLPNVTLASLVGNQVVVNPPAALESGKPPLLPGGDRPADPQFSDNDTPAFGERPALPPARSNTYRRAELAALMKEHRLGLDAVEAIADRLGITERPMSDASMDALIDAIHSERAASAHAPAPSTPDADARSPQPATATASEDEADPPGTSSEPSPALSMDQVLAAAGPGAEEVPPRPGTDAYKALPSGAERAKARAYWDAHKEPEPQQESLVSALGGPSGG